MGWNGIRMGFKRLQNKTTNRAPAQKWAQRQKWAHLLSYAMSKEIHRLQLLLATSDLRGRPSIEQAVILVLEHEASQRDASFVCRVSRGALRRAISAKKEGRKISVRGRPKHLTQEEEDKLIENIDNAINRREPPTYIQFQNMVCINLFHTTLYTHHHHLIFHKLIILKCKDVFKNTPGKNLALGVPVFSRSYRDRFVKKNGFTTRSARPIEQVSVY